MDKQPKGKLEQGLLQALQAVDNQVARAMERTPAEREERGVQKWKPFSERIELLSTFLIDSFSEDEIGLDSLLVFSEVFPKVLGILADELGNEGLGKVRAAYVESVLEHIERDAGRSLRQLRGSGQNLM